MINDLERRIGAGLVAKGGISGLPARIESVHGFNPHRDVIPIDWDYIGGQGGIGKNPDLAEATDAIINHLSQKYGREPSNYWYVKYESPSERATTDEAVLVINGQRLRLGPADVYTWIRDRREIPILALTQDPELKKLRYLQVIIFEHPEQPGVYVYQVTGFRDLSKREFRVAKADFDRRRAAGEDVDWLRDGFSGPYAILFDAGFYHKPSKRLAESRTLPASQNTRMRGEPASLPKY